MGHIQKVTSFGSWYSFNFAILNNHTIILLHSTKKRYVNNVHHVINVIRVIFINSFVDSWQSIQDESGAVLIDRSPVYFEPVLNFLRHGRVILDDGVNPQGLYRSQQLFQIGWI